MIDDRSQPEDARTPRPDPLPGGSPGARQRLAEIMALVRDMSVLSDPNELVTAYSRRVRTLWEASGILSLSRRDLAYPYVRITRFTGWGEKQPDPWRERDALPLIKGGMLAELLYAAEARIINDFRLDPTDPAYPYLGGVRAITAVPHFDHGQALNMVVQYRTDGTFDPERFPEGAWLSNLFGRGVNNMVLSRQLREAYDEIDRELKVVGEIQQSLLPSELPTLRTLELATYYQTSRRAGGDYFDFFELPDNKLGILLADVSGHGTPAAVLMAVLHALAHQFPGTPEPPDRVLSYINSQLCRKYTDGGTFVTAVYALYDDRHRTLSYASAGHNPPLLLRDGQQGFERLTATGLPLGIMHEAEYGHGAVRLNSGDQLVLYTDGITETRALGSAAMFGEEMLAEAARRGRGPQTDVIGQILDEVTTFSGGEVQADDRTLILAKVKPDRPD